MAKARDDTGLPSLATDLWEMVVAYLKQETIEPLKRLGGFLKYGVVGAAVLSMGLVMLAVAGLRALQTETGSTFRGNWSWAPYGITLVGCAVVIALAARAIGSKKRKAARKGSIA